MRPIPARLALCLAALPCVAAADDINDVVEIAASRQPYRSLSATAATKTETDLRDLPQSARVLTAGMLRDAGVTRLADALDLGSGISRQSNFGGVWDSYAVRGFAGDPNYGSDYLVNGFSSSRGYNGQRDSANAASIEILKGPAAALYGRGEPGGIINIATRKPLFQPAYSVSQSLSTHQGRRSAADLTGPAGEQLAWRLNGAYEQGGSQRGPLWSRHSLLSPSLLWRVSDATTVSLESEIAAQRAFFDRGVVAVNGVLGAVPNTRFLGEPGDGPMTVRSTGHQLFIQHDLAQDWSLQGGLSYRASSMRGYSTEASALQADGRTLWRQRRYRDFSAQDWSGRLELVGSINAGALRHHLLAGVDGYRFLDDRLQLRKSPNAAAPYAIDILAPLYGGAAPTALGASINTREQQWSAAVYVQDQVDLGAHWKALLGLRRDSYRQTVVNRNRASLANHQQLDVSSPRAGLVYQPDRVWAWYVSAGRSFRPNSGIGINNESFPAERSTAWEAGVKTDSADGKWSSTLALYRIGKRNVLTLNPLDTNYSLGAGEVASRGLELDVAGEVARRLRLSLSYAYTDAHVVRDNVLRPGTALANVPRHGASLLLVRELQVDGKRASLGGGLHYVGTRNGDVAVSSSFRLPAYTTAKLVSSYQATRRLRLSLDMDNLFNRTYYPSAYQPTWVAAGEDRRATVQVSYSF
ncbi:TonB-dependent siderophore receptor [Oxalobacteraceae bacterium A2-2]